MFCKKGILRKLAKFTGIHLCQSLCFNKVAGLSPATLLKKRLVHRCFPVNFAKFLRTLFEEAATRDVLKNFVLFTVKYLYYRVYLFIKVEVCNFIKKETMAQVFFMQFLRTLFYRTSTGDCSVHSSYAVILLYFL